MIVKDENELKLLRLQGFYTKDKTNLTLFQDLFELTMSLGRFSEAKDLLVNLEAKLCEEPIIKFDWSKFHIAQAEYEIALEILETLLTDGTVNTGVIYNILWCKLNLKRFQEVIEEMDKHSNFVDEYPAFQLLKIRAMHNLGRIEEALFLVQHYLEFNKDDQDALGLKAILSLDLGRYDEASVAADMALILNPFNHEALTVLSSVALVEQNPDKALVHLSKSENITTRSGRMMLNLGQAQMLNMDFLEAEESLKKASELMPDHIGTWHALAWVELVQNKVDFAEQSLQKAMDLDRNFSETHGGLAVIAVRKGNIDLARKLTKTALRLDPNCVSGRYAESLLLEASGEVQLAKEKVTNLIESTKSGDGRPLTELINQANQRFSSKPNNGQIH